MLAALGPVLLALYLLPPRATFGLAGALFVTLLIVIVVAAVAGVWPAIVAAAIGFLVDDGYFSPPYDT